MDAENLHVSVGTGLTILGLSFGAWAWVVAWGVGIIRKEIGELKQDFKNSAEANSTRNIHIENRISRLEVVAALCRGVESR